MLNSGCQVNMKRSGTKITRGKSVLMKYHQPALALFQLLQNFYLGTEFVLFSDSLGSEALPMHSWADSCHWAQHCNRFAQRRFSLTKALAVCVPDLTIQNVFKSHLFRVKVFI